MAERWALAFSVAAWTAVVVTAGLRRRSRARGRHEARRLEPRALGGVAVTAAAAAGSLAAPGVPLRIGIAALAAVALTVFALLSDARTFSPRARVAGELAAAVVAVAGGIQAEVTGSHVTDLIVTVVWLVALPEAIRGLDHTDGLASGVTAVSAAGIFALAGFADQASIASLAAALAGCSLGFLAYNLRPASVYLRDSGSLFLGFALAVLIVETNPAVGPPGSYGIGVLLTGVALLDLVLVTGARLVRGLRLDSTRRDRLAHRLVAIGISHGVAVYALVAAQLLWTIVAVFVGRRVLGPVIGTVIAVAVLAVLVVAARTGGVYPDARRRLPPLRRRLLAAVLVLGFVVLVASAAAAVVARHLVDDGRAAIQRGLNAAHNGDAHAARAAFNDAVTQFHRAGLLIGNPLTTPGLVVPVLGQNLHAAHELADVGAQLARAGEHLAATTDPKRLKIRDGTVPVQEVQRVSPQFAAATQTLDQAVRRLGRLTFDRSVVGPVRDAVDRVNNQLGRARREAINAATAARLTPALFGGDGVRRYFLAVQNPAEARATGGIIGNWGILTADHGTIRLEQFDRIAVLNEDGVSPAASRRMLDAPDDFKRRYARFGPTQILQNVNLSPSFPTVARVIEGLYTRMGRGPLDGVIAVDPAGLSALLQLTGPVAVLDWPVPLTPENVVDVTLRQAYDRFGGENQTRVDFLGDIAHQVVNRVTQGSLGSPAHIAQALGRVARDGHIILSFVRPDEEALARQLGVADEVPPVRSDSLLVATQNAAANKVDYYLRRHLTYQVTLDPDPSLRRVRVQSTLTVRLDNAAPAGVRSFALGPFDPRFAPGENRSFISLYTPLGFRSASFAGLPTGLQPDRELGRSVYSMFGSVAAGTTGTLVVAFDGTVNLTRGGWYQLDLLHQPTLTPDDVTVTVKLAPGWEISGSHGLVAATREAGGRWQVSANRTVSIQLRRVSEGNLWDRLVAGR